MVTDRQIKEVLTKYKNIAVVGLSPDPDRPSFGVSQYMQSQGYNIIPVRPPGGERILGVESVSKLGDIVLPVEIINVFRRSEFVPKIVDEAITVKAKVIWLQEGVIHPAAEEKARQAGLIVLSDLCILKEHARLFR